MAKKTVRPAVFVRNLKHGPPLESGKDVAAVQRALAKANCLNLRNVQVGKYGENTWLAVERFTKKSRVKDSKDYTLPVHTALKPYFDAYGRWLLNEAAGDLAEEEQKNDQRERVIQTAFFYYGERNDIGYSQDRPITTIYYGIRPPQTPRYLDCSGLACTSYWVPGLLSALGAKNQGGYGNTWSLYDYGTFIDSIVKARPGDLIFYGNCSHVAVYVGNGKVVSHGSAIGPLVLSWNYRGVYGIRSYLK